MRRQDFEQSLREMIGHQFDRRAGKRQEPALGSGKYPAAGAESDLDFFFACSNPNGRMARGQEHHVIEFGENRFHDPQQGQKVDHTAELVQRARELDSHAVVVAVQRFATAVRQHDEMGRTVDQVIASDADRIMGHATTDR